VSREERIEKVSAALNEIPLPLIEQLRQQAETWATLKRRVSLSGGVSWNECSQMSVFDFFTIVSKIEAEAAAKNSQHR
jgi:hypothetical protein